MFAWTIEQYNLPRKSRSLIKKNSFREYVDEFCENSSVHGIKYMADKHRPWIERFWWLIAFVLSAWGCIYLILSAYHRWEDNPIIVSFMDKMTPITEIPFPAVTICPDISLDASIINVTALVEKLRRENSPDVTKILTKEQQSQLDVASKVCPTWNLKNAIWENIHSDFDIVSLMKEGKSKIPTDSIANLQWHRRTMDFHEVMSEYLSDVGICYTFNNLDQSEIYREENIQTDYRYYGTHRGPAKNWSLENGYSSRSPLEGYPYRTFTSGSQGELGLLFPMNAKDYFPPCHAGSTGVKIALHHPGDVPMLYNTYIQMPSNSYMRIIVKPNMITTSEKLNSYSTDRRQCYFPNERYLRFFKIYSQNNCEIECLSNATLDGCGCVEFYMPRSEGTPICGTSKFECTAWQSIIYHNHNELFSRESCDCKPSCTSLTYEVEVNPAPFELHKAVDPDLRTKLRLHDKFLYYVQIMFRDNQFLGYRRSELFGSSEFMANCGGLLGLFMGMSILSIVETIYFFTLRWWYQSLKRKRDRQKQNLLTTRRSLTNFAPSWEQGGEESSTISVN